jgi:RNA polymerase sigma-70 factor (ECF subfamily)
MGTATARDEELVSRIKSGDAQSFDILVKAYQLRTYRKVRRLVPVEDAEDVTQDIFMNLVCSIDNFKGKSAFATWFNKIILNRVADYHRKMFRYKSRFTSEIDMMKYELHQEADTELEMRDLLMNLPETYREVLLLRFCHDLSFREISSVLGIAYEAVRSRYRRGIKCAAKKMQIHSRWTGKNKQII